MSEISSVDLTWLARITFNTRDRPTSTWLPPGQRLVGRRFNDPTRPEWMDDAEWEHAIVGSPLRHSPRSDPAQADPL